MQYKLILPEPSIFFSKSCDLWPHDLVSLSLTLVLKIKNRKGNQKNNKKENKKKLSLPLLVLILTLPNDLFIVKFTNSRLKDLSILFYFIHFHFHFVLFSYFLFLEQLGSGLEVIGYNVTSVTIWWCGHNIGHKTWENEVEGSRTNDIIQHNHLE